MRRATAPGLYGLSGGAGLGREGGLLCQICKVCRHSDQEPAVEARKRSLSAAFDQPQVGMVQRQRAWLRGRNAGAKAAAWRPAPRHRVSAKHWLQNLDNQARISFRDEGLKFFKPNYGVGLWSDWRTHPFAVTPMDLGLDGVCGLFAAQYKWGLAIEGFLDGCHAGNRAIVQMLEATGFHPLICLWVVHVNRREDCLAHLRTAWPHCFSDRPFIFGCK